MGRLAPRQSLWPPYCGAEFGYHTEDRSLDLGSVPRWPELDGRMVAGDPVICDRAPHNPCIRHRNEELGFEWW